MHTVQFPTLTSWSSRRALVCERAGWRCQICYLPEGSRVLGPTGRFYRIFLTVDEQRRVSRALCQRCRIHETQETACLPVPSIPANVGKRSPLHRLHIELVPIKRERPDVIVRKPLLPPECAAWMR
jgi:hypothetical protein